MPYKPNDVTVAVSTADVVSGVPAEVPDRLDVSWKSPTLDAATQLFSANDGGEIISAKRFASYEKCPWLCRSALGLTYTAILKG